MDLDHTSLASRPCAMRECKMRDFLPFLCGVCKHTYCLDHRSYKAHDCVGETMKDIHSFECPLCLRTIKYDKLSDPNEMFQQHYSSCTQLPDKSKLAANLKKCIECNTKLGLSNGYYCKKCDNNTCLAHRNSDDHKCVLQKRGIATIAARGSSNTNSKNLMSDKQQKLLNNLKTSINTHKVPPTKSTAAPVISDNTLKGSVFARMQGVPRTAVVDTTQSHKCPYCSFASCDDVFLAVHMEDVHSGSAAAASSPAIYSSSGGESCPRCQQVFAEVGQLIAHFESAHSDNPSSSDNSNKSNLSDNCNLN